MDCLRRGYGGRNREKPATKSCQRWHRHEHSVRAQSPAALPRRQHRTVCQEPAALLRKATKSSTCVTGGMAAMPALTARYFRSCLSVLELRTYGVNTATQTVTSIRGAALQAGSALTETSRSPSIRPAGKIRECGLNKNCACNGWHSPGCLVKLGTPGPLWKWRGARRLLDLQISDLRGKSTHVA